MVRESGEVDYNKTGFAVLKKEKSVPSNYNMVRMPLLKNERATLFVRFEGVKKWRQPDSIQFQVLKEDWWATQNVKDWWYGVLLGVFLIQFFYILFLAIMGKEQKYFYLLFSLFGLLIYYSEAQSFELSNSLIDFFRSIYGLGFIFFLGGIVRYTEVYFEISNSDKILKFTLKIFYFLFFLITFSQVAFILNLSLGVASLAALVFFILGIPLSIVMAVSKRKANKALFKYYFIAFSMPISVLLIGFIVAIFLQLFNANLFEKFNGFVEYLLEVSLILMVALLALGDGYQTRRLKEEKENALLKNLNDQKHINKVISRFVPNEFLRSLGKKSITEISLGDHIEKRVSIFFSDIRNFTGLSEQLSPDDNFRFIQNYNNLMGPVIRQHQGFVNQFLGDGIMAIFPQRAEDALKAAIHMQKEIRSYNQVRVKNELSTIKVGMGIHTGSLIMGIIGDDNRMDATTISDSVNTAARIESLTKYFGTNILLSEDCFNELNAAKDFQVRFLGKVRLKGKVEPVGIYECFDGDEIDMIQKKTDSLSWFNKAMDLYFSKYFSEAKTAFEKVLRINSEDQVAKYFLTKSLSCLENGVPDDWAGIEEMKGK